MKLGFLNGFSTGKLGAGKAVSGGGGDPIGDALRADAAAYWKMDEASGTRVDATGNGFDLSDLNNAGSATGKNGNGLLVSGAAHYARYNGTGLQFGDTSFSIAAWVKIAAFAVGQSQNIFSYINDSTFEVEWALESDDFGDYFGMAFYTLAQTIDTFDFGAIVTDQWYFVVCEYNKADSKERLYIDNVLARESALVANIATANVVSFGLEATGLGSTNCIRDEVLVINRVLTTAEKDYLYNSGSGRTLYP